MKALASVMFTLCFSGVVFAQGETYAEALGRMGYKHGRKGDFVFLQATDLHSSETDRGATRMPNKFEGKSFVDDMNALSPAPAFALFTGDLISETSKQPNTWDRAEKYWARYRRIIVDRAQLPIWQIIGNNDCAELPYKKIFPERPIYWTFSRDGVCFFGVHGYSMWQTKTSNHSGILIDPEQLALMDKTISESGADTLAIVTHEPLWENDTHCVRRQLAPVLKKFRGEEIWNIAGHGHANVSVRFKIGERSVYGVETTSPVGAWSPTNGAYRVFAVSGGRITASSLRWLTKNGDPVSFEAAGDVRRSPRIALIEDALAKDAVKTYMIGEEDIPLRRDFRSVEDRISGLRFHGKGACATYAVPLEGAGAKCLRLAANLSNPEAVAISCDGETWQMPAIKKSSRFSVIEIPAGWKKLFFKIGKQGYNVALYGFSIVASNDRPGTPLQIQ